MPQIVVLDYIRLEVPCPHCGQKSLQLLRQLVANDQITCPRCGERIDISSKEWRALIDKAVDGYSKITGYSRE